MNFLKKIVLIILKPSGSDWFSRNCVKNWLLCVNLRCRCPIRLEMINFLVFSLWLVKPNWTEWIQCLWSGISSVGCLSFLARSFEFLCSKFSGLQKYWFGSYGNFIYSFASVAFEQEAHCKILITVNSRAHSPNTKTRMYLICWWLCVVFILSFAMNVCQLMFNSMYILYVWSRY